MRRPVSGRTPVRWLFVLTLVGSVLLIGLRGDVARVPSYLDTFPTAFARLIRSADEREWDAYADRHGIRPFLALVGELVGEAPTRSPRAFDRYWRDAAPLIDRIDSLVRRRTGRAYVRLEAEFHRRGGFRAHVARRALWTRVLAAADSTVTPAADRIARLEALVRHVDSLGSPQLRGRIRAKLVYEYARVQDQPSMWRHARAARSWALACEQPLMECELVGVIGQLFETEGLTDTALAWWTQGRQLARRYDLPDQQARFCSFIASHHQRRGSFAEAERWHEATLEVLDRYDLGPMEDHYLERIGQAHLRLGAWDAARRVHERVMHALANRHRWVDGTTDARLPSRLEGELAFHDGDVVTGNRRFEQLERLDRQGHAGTRDPEYYHAWARALNDNGRPGDALRVIDRARVRTTRFPQLAAQLELQRVQALFRLRGPGEAAGAIAALDSLARLASLSTADRVTRQVWASRVALALGRPDSALAAAIVALSLVREGARRSDASAQGYVWFEQCRDVRLALHAALDDDAFARYGVEVVWADVQRLLGAPGPDRPIAGLRPFPRLDRRTLRETGARAVAAQPNHTAHLHYVNGAGDIWRFVVVDGTLTLDTLAGSAVALRRLMDGVLARLGRELPTPGTPPDAPLVLDLKLLADALLPPRVALARSTPRGVVIVSGDAVVTALPFEALNIGPHHEYHPLLDVADVVYLRRLARGRASHPPSRSGRSVVLADPQLPDAVSRKLGGLAGLRGAQREAAAAARWLRPAELLLGTRAHRAALLDLWEDARVIVIAAHAIQPRDFPKSASIPLAPEPRLPSEPSYLDVHHVRGADLSRCELAVLSGCATGRPSMAGDLAVPSFAETVLDAGAHAAVWTFWDVRDDQAQATTEALLERWRGRGQPLVRALGDARRDMRRSRPHPHEWAAFGIELAELNPTHW